LSLDLKEEEEGLFAILNRPHRGKEAYNKAETYNKAGTSVRRLPKSLKNASAIAGLMILVKELMRTALSILCCLPSSTWLLLLNSRTCFQKT